MTITRRVIQITGVTVGAIGAVAVAMPDTPPGRAARRLGTRLGRDIRYVVASAPGLLYRLGGRTPDPDASDDIVADRIRSSIGPLEKQLDLPRIHVMVDQHVAILHGEVGTAEDAFAIERAVLNVSGVDGVESHLHIGLVSGDTRPSSGHASQPASHTLRRLLDAAFAAGATEPRAAVHTVLCGFFDRIPATERTQVFAHLPDDVRALSGPPRRLGAESPKLRTVAQLVATATAEGGVDADRAEAITIAIVQELHDLVPEEARDVAAVLPKELRELWGVAAPS